MVVLDDADRLGGAEVECAGHLARGLARDGVPVAFLLTGGPELGRRFARNGNFGGYVWPMSLGPFDEAEAREALVVPAADRGVEFEESAARAVMPRRGRPAAGAAASRVGGLVGPRSASWPGRPRGRRASPGARGAPADGVGVLRARRARSCRSEGDGAVTVGAMENPYVERVAQATDKLLATTSRLDDVGAAGPSLLPDWDRSMVLTHLAANADGTRRALEAAAKGEVGEVYPGGRPARDAEIEAGRARPAREVEERLRAACEQLAAALENASDEAWESKAVHPSGEVRIGPGLVVGRPARSRSTTSTSVMATSPGTGHSDGCWRRWTAP